MSKALTAAERRVIRKFALAYKDFIELPICHEADDAEVRYHVHAVQNIVMARAAVRAFPAEFHSAPSFALV